MDLAYVVGTFDTKGRELAYVAELARAAGARVVTVDVSTTGSAAGADVTAAEVAAHHPDGADAVFTGDRGAAVTAMAEALERVPDRARRRRRGVIGAGRLRRHRAGHPRDARAAGRPAQGHGLDRRQRATSPPMSARATSRCSTR